MSRYQTSVAVWSLLAAPAVLFWALLMFPDELAGLGPAVWMTVLIGAPACTLAAAAWACRPPGPTWLRATVCLANLATLAFWTWVWTGLP